MSKTVVVGMSGGVDSSVSALLLKQEGYKVIGVFMKNWEEKDVNGVCKASVEYEDALRVCDKIGIPCYSVNFSSHYWDRVFAECLEEFKKGSTPNPDVLCNQEIKFKVLWEKAKDLGADHLATGHYCRIGEAKGQWQLLKGLDPNKDQSYFLYRIRQDVLQHVIFPVGALPKQEVREIARKHHLPTAEKKDSTGICFIGKRNFKEFLKQYIPPQPGNFETGNGEVVGRHESISFYTIGQRKGLGIGGAGEAWYVIGKDVARNVVLVEQGAKHPSLYSESLVAFDLTWISPEGAPPVPWTCMSKIRYRQADHPCTLREICGGRAWVDFPSPQRAVTPLQSIVFYDGDVCLGGGTIES